MSFDGKERSLHLVRFLANRHQFFFYGLTVGVLSHRTAIQTSVCLGKRISEVIDLQASVVHPMEPCQQRLNSARQLLCRNIVWEYPSGQQAC